MENVNIQKLDVGGNQKLLIFQKDFIKNNVNVQKFNVVQDYINVFLKINKNNNLVSY